MFLLTRPTSKQIEKFISFQSAQKFSYAEVGTTRDMKNAPRGYTLDRNRVRLGTGRDTYLRAVAALRSWQMFATSLTTIHPKHARVKVGQTVAILARHFGFYSLNACRIVYVIDDATPEITRRGFAYGTLSEHGEQGEERFTIEWHHASDELWYDLLAFSRPKHFAAIIGYPVSRSLQKQFAKESKAAMIKAVQRDLTHTV